MKGESKFILAFFANAKKVAAKGPIVAPMALQNFMGHPHERPELKIQGWVSYIIPWTNPTPPTK